jgi:hypothetical protein
MVVAVETSVLIIQMVQAAAGVERVQEDSLRPTPLVALVATLIYKILLKAIHWVAVGQRVEVMVIYLGITLSSAARGEGQAK